jgi:hypothetical protein
MDKFSYINIREYLIQNNPNGIGEADLQEAISDFSCPRNPDVEHFLKDNAIEFTKKNQSVTYLVLSNEDGIIVGYFTIALKPITVNANRMSNTVKRKLQRISKLDEATETYTAAAFLIAQLGKNFTNQLNERISGEELLDMAWTVVKELQYAAGGVVSFLEADRKEKLLDFYYRNGFREFDVKMIEDSEGNLHELVQLLRLM